MSTPTSRVLKLLLEAQGPRSGQEMGRLLGCSRAAVGKAVANLRQRGFVIEARPRAGYLLVAEPEAVLAERVEARLPEGCLGRPLLHYQTIDSTNLEARRLAEAGAAHGACLCAEHQSAGRGRLGRVWQAPVGASLLFSLLLRPVDLPVELVFLLNNVVSLAVCRAVEGLCGLRAMVKWPNDVFLDGRKLVGVLTEFTCRADRIDHVVVGAGLNVNWSADDLARLPAPAASLLAASGRRWDRAVLLAAILRQADALYATLQAGRLGELRDEYQRQSLLLGRQVTIDDGGALVSGQVAGFEPDGALRLDTGPGRVRIVRHGDVSIKSIAGLEGRE